MTQNNYNGALQKTIGSPFNASSTAADIIKGIDLTGKTIIITGGYAGIGLETTKTFLETGATVIVPARDVQKAEKNLRGAGNAQVETMDLMDPASIDAFAKKFLATGRSLHLLINNAGIMWVPLRRDKRGYESQLATNHLGHFQLTARLWPALKKAGCARVVTVSSFGHQMSPFHFKDPHFIHRAYETLQGYGQSKTANNLFTVELDNRGKHHGVRAYSLHPGSVNGTELGREAPVDLFRKMGMFDDNGNLREELAAKLKSIAQGAATTVWCATYPGLENIGGVYCEDAEIAVLDDGTINHRYDDPSSNRGVQPYSLDEINAKLLWTLSEKMTNVSFDVN